MNFSVLAWLDTFDLVASLPERIGFFKPTEQPGRRVFDIRWQDEAAEGGWKASSQTARWPQLTSLINKVARGAAVLIPDAVIERGPIFMELLDSGTVVPWVVVESGYWRLHLALRTNPGCMMFAGTEAAHIFPGQLTLVRNGWQSAVNFGEYSRVHLVIDLRKASPETAMLPSDAGR